MEYRETDALETAAPFASSGMMHGSHAWRKMSFEFLRPSTIG